MKPRNGLFHCATVATTALLLAGCSNPERDKIQALERGNADLAARRVNEAIIQYRIAVQQDANFGEARLKLAEAYELNGDAGRAMPEFIRAADLLPQNDAVQLRSARYLLAAGRFEDAATRAQLVLNRNPRHVDALVIRGNSLLGMRDFDRAISEIEEAISLDPTRESSYTTLAVVRMSAGQRAEARKALEAAVSAAPTSPRTHLSLAYFHWSVGELMDAERALQRALDLAQDDVLVNRTAAMFYMSSKRMAQAEPFVQKVVARDGRPAAKLALADFYMAAGRLPEGVRTLKSLTGEAALKSAVQMRLAILAYRAGNRTEARSTLAATLADDPKNVPALLTQGRWLLADRRVDDAIRIAESAVALQPASTQGQYLLGLGYETAGRMDEAARAYGEALRLNPQTAVAQLALARVQLARGSGSSAVELAQQARTSQPDNPDARATYARTLIRARAFARAAPEVASLRREFPKNAVVLALEGYLLAATGRFAESERAYESAVALEPRYVDGLVGLATAKVSLKKVDEARRLIVAATTAQPDVPALLTTAARVHLVASEFTQAETALQRSIAVAPAHLEAFGLLAQLYLAQGKLDRATEQLKVQAAAAPNPPFPQTLLGILAQTQNRLDDAREWYQAALKIDARSAVAANNLAWLYAESGEQLDQALRLARIAADVSPDSAQFRDTLGWVYYKQQLPSLAVPEFDRAIANEPANADFHYHLGLAHQHAGDTVRAQEAFSTALRLKPTATQFKKALESLN